jgi:hypothetical protein
MAFILPEDISNRISLFMEGNYNFPFIQEDEIMSVLFLYGWQDSGMNKSRLPLIEDIATKTVNKIGKQIEKYQSNGRNMLINDFVRSGYIKRQLQVAIEERQNPTSESNIINDPAILTECFSQHVAYYNQEYFFVLYGPLKKSEVTKELEQVLTNKIVMLGFNVSEKKLPFSHPTIPFYIWARDNLL